jgi:hypothetical protein
MIANNHTTLNRDLVLDYRHRHSAHCESGVTSAILKHNGLDISEAMVFGLGAGLYFVHWSMIKIYGLPLTGYRNYVGRIIKGSARRLGVTFKQRKFRSPAAAMAALDQALEQGLPVALRTGIYWLPYVPEAFRFHFNGHNIIVYGKKGRDYLISDPVFDQVAVCSDQDLARARFAQGPFAPSGVMYYPVKVPQKVDLRQPVTAAIREVRRNMTRPFPNFIGLRGMRTLAAKIPGLPQKLGLEMAIQNLAMVVRMQEEIGTGGGGFRFMYASFLQEAADLLQRDDLAELSQDLTKVGDHWREFALKCARICKKRLDSPERYQAAAQTLRECADLEEMVYKRLKKAGF